MHNKFSPLDVLIGLCVALLALVPCTDAAQRRRVLQVTRQGDVVPCSMLLNSAVAVESDGTFEIQNSMKDTSIALMVRGPPFQAEHCTLLLAFKYRFARSSVTTWFRNFRVAAVHARSCDRSHVCRQTHMHTLWRACLKLPGAQCSLLPHKLCKCTST